MTEAKPWLWPNKIIRKRESRLLADEHNALVNAHNALVNQFTALVGAAEKVLVNSGEPADNEPQNAFDDLRNAISNPRK